MYKCNECRKKFENPNYKRTTHEDEYGVGDLFSNKHYVVIETCPYCGSDDIDEFYDEEEEVEDG